MATRIVIADRQKMFREALKNLLESEQDFEVTGETDDGEMLPGLIADLKPDVLLMDLKLRRNMGTEALQEIAASQPDVRPIVLTDEIAQSEIIQALLWGARGVVRKDAPSNLLFKSIRMVHAGQYWMSHDESAELVRTLRSLTALVEQSTQLQTRNLSDQQQKIVEAIVAGCSNREIAKELSVSERTIKYHLTRIFNTFGVSGRMELARVSLKKKNTREA
jgi:two-component system, NarL family, nitrate/nitrite response regulator NarL